VQIHLIHNWWHNILPTVLLEDMSLLSYGSVGIFSLLWNGAIVGTRFHGKGRVFRWSGTPSAAILYFVIVLIQFLP